MTPKTKKLLAGALVLVLLGAAFWYFKMRPSNAANKKTVAEAENATTDSSGKLVAANDSSNPDESKVIPAGAEATVMKVS